MTALAKRKHSNFVECLGKCPMLPVAMRPGETPVPIPNTMVKARAADGTMLETAWESRWLPDLRMGL